MWSVRKFCKQQLHVMNDCKDEASTEVWTGSFCTDGHSFNAFDD